MPLPPAGPLPSPTLVGGARVWPGAPNPEMTLGRMVKIILAEYELPSFVELADSIVVRAEEKNTAAVAAALLTWLREHTRFVPDPIAQQSLKSPTYMVAAIRQAGVIGGDCVDVAMLAAALAMAVGLNAALVAEAYQGGPTAPLVHVYAVVQTQNGWVNMDTQRSPNAAAVEPARREWVTIP